MTASGTHGHSLRYVWLQPLSHTVTASATCGCRGAAHRRSLSLASLCGLSAAAIILSNRPYLATRAHGVAGWRRRTAGCSLQGGRSALKPIGQQAMTPAGTRAQAVEWPLFGIHAARALGPSRIPGLSDPAGHPERTRLWSMGSTRTTGGAALSQQVGFWSGGWPRGLKRASEGYPKEGYSDHAATRRRFELVPPGRNRSATIYVTGAATQCDGGCNATLRTTTCSCMHPGCGPLVCR